jgi:hypothetical protein
MKLCATPRHEQVFGCRADPGHAAAADGLLTRQDYWLTGNARLRANGRKATCEWCGKTYEQQVSPYHAGTHRGC